MMIGAPPVNLINRTNFGCPALSPDGSTIYFDANTQYWGGYGSGDILQVQFVRIVDFNADGIVDLTDLVKLIGSWGKEGNAYDLSPLPLGDGIVNEADLEVLMGYWGQEVNDPTLVGHWALDETEGVTACDSAGGNEGTIMGLPQWRPQAGTIAGALELDGTSFVTATCPLSPADGPFSVLAWIKGGLPGQVIISQEGGANWLLSDPATGVLMTELKSGGRSTTVLHSDAIITDDIWHRVSFTWDSANRRLYVDDILVAEDTQQNLAASSGNLIIGAGTSLTPGTFWTGLIDDVRIYNRAVKP
jgi:hypothetical protein